MREILFRGKRKDNGEWVEFTPLGALFANPLNIEVELETVGTYTGITDKNGKKIFEGDIIKSTSDVVDFRGIKSGVTVTNFYEVVVTDDNSSYTYGEREIGRTYISKPIYKEYAERFCEVIGNIHDNPDLLESEDEG